MIDKAKKIFVTGGTGFVGSYTLKLLLQSGFTNIIAQKRSSSRMGMVEDIVDRIQWVDTDILDIASLESCFTNTDYVIHTAAIVDLDPRKRKQLYKTNFEGTANVVNLCLANNIKKLIHLSSIEALGKSDQETIITEQQEWEEDPANSHYAVSKHLAEMEVWRGKEEGLDVLILNPSLILGAGYWDSGTASIIDKAYGGIPFYPTGSIGIVDVRDVAKAIYFGLISDIKNERIIISAENMSYETLFQKLSHALGTKAPKRKLSNTLGQIFWRLDGLKSRLTGSERLLSQDSFKITSTKCSYDNSVSKELLQMEYLSIEKSIAQIVSLFLNSKSSHATLSF